MHCKCALLVFSVVQKLIHDVVLRCRTVKEIKIDMLDSMLSELFLIILRFIQSYYHGDSHFLEDRHVVLRRERSVPVCHV